jgi:hypothetical protein
MLPKDELLGDIDRDPAHTNADIKPGGLEGGMDHRIQEGEPDELAYALFLENKLLLDLRSVSENQCSLLEYYRVFADGWLSRIPHENLDLRFGFFASPAIQGQAISRSEAHPKARFATVSSGAISYFHEFFSYLLSRVDIWPHVGRVTAERNLPHVLAPRRTVSPVQELAKRRLVRSVTPNDPIRRQFAGIMAEVACKSLILHEIGHCVNGHLFSAPFALDEETQAAGPAMDSALRAHTLEMDADACASNYFLRLAFDEIESGTSFRWSNVLNRFPPCKLL